MKYPPRGHLDGAKASTTHAKGAYGEGCTPHRGVWGSSPRGIFTFSEIHFKHFQVLLCILVSLKFRMNFGIVLYKDKQAKPFSQSVLMYHI